MGSTSSALVPRSNSAPVRIAPIVKIAAAQAAFDNLHSANEQKRAAHPDV